MKFVFIIMKLIQKRKKSCIGEKIKISIEENAIVVPFIKIILNRNKDCKIWNINEN